MEDTQFFAELYDDIKLNTSESFQALIEDKASYPYLYHLSEIRENLIDWLPITMGMKVLEYHAECGALTGRLLSLSGDVTAVTQSSKQAKIIQQRNAGTKGLVVLLEDEAKEKLLSYDIILIAGNVYQAVNLLPLLREHLRPEGMLIIADANRIGLKYLAGCGDEYADGFFSCIEGDSLAHCYTKKEYARILKEAGFKDLEFYYPYPDYKFPSCIYSDERLPQKGELSDNRRNFDKDRYQLFDERRAFDTMIAEGLFGELSNSFLIAARTGKKPETRTVYAKYSNERAQRFQIRTDIVRDSDGTKRAYKYPLKKSGHSHIAVIEQRYQELSDCYRDTRITFCPCEIEREAVGFDYIEGMTLQEIMEQAVTDKNKELVFDIIKDYIHRINYHGGNRPFVVTGAFKEVFGNVTPAGELQSAAISDIDMILSNILVPSGVNQKIEDLNWTVIDYEWSFDFPVPKQFVIFRALYFAYYQILNDTEISLQELLQMTDITAEQQECFLHMEEGFQHFIGQGGVPVRNMQRAMGTKIISFAELTNDFGRRTSEEVIPESAWIKVKKIQYNVDRLEYQDGSFVCCGWAFAVTKDGRTLPVNIQIEDGTGKSVKAEVTRTMREDVADALRIKKVSKPGWGFNCVFIAPSELKWKIIFSLGKCEKVHTCSSKIK